MSVSSENIRNIAIVGHSGEGKKDGVVERLHAADDLGHGLRHEHRADNLAEKRDRYGNSDNITADNLFGSAFSLVALAGDAIEHI